MKKKINFTVGISVIIFFIALSIRNQIKYTFLPFARNYKNIPYMLSKDDLGRLKELAYPFYRVISELNKYPNNTNFYFAPSFSSQDEAMEWYLYILMRYFSYPRKVFRMHNTVYGGNKDEYLNKYIGSAKKYSDLEWMRERNINYIILLKDGAVFILPTSTDINN